MLPLFLQHSSIDSLQVFVSEVVVELKEIKMKVTDTSAINPARLMRTIVLLVMFLFFFDEGIGKIVTGNLNNV